MNKKRDQMSYYNDLLIGVQINEIVQKVFDVSKYILYKIVFDTNITCIGLKWK